MECVYLYRIMSSNTLRQDVILPDICSSCILGDSKQDEDILTSIVQQTGENT